MTSPCLLGPEKALEAYPLLAGQKVDFLVKGDGDAYFPIPRGRSFDLGRLVDAIRRRVGGEAEE